LKEKIKMKKLTFMYILFLLVPIITNAQQNDFPNLTGPYLGQKPPGITPEMFAPGIISTDKNEFSITISPIGDEIFFTRIFEKNHQKIMVTRLEDGQWTHPEPLPFSEEYPCFEPGFSPDGKKLFFNYWKPFDKNEPVSCDIWYIEKTDKGWSDPKHLDSPFNPGKAMYISVTTSGTIYTTDLTNGFSDMIISRSKLINGQYADYEKIGPPVSIGKSDMYPYIAPDESFLIFSTKRLNENKDVHLFSTTPDEKGNWNEPELIDTGFNINNMPFLTFDKKYLFFTSSGNIYWISAKIIK